MTVTPEDTERHIKVLKLNPDARYVRLLPDGMYAVAEPLMFHWTIKLGHEDDPIGYDDRWCFESEHKAAAALYTWDYPGQVEPEGWHRHPRTGRRRVGGDPLQEHVAH